MTNIRDQSHLESNTVTTVEHPPPGERDVVGIGLSAAMNSAFDASSQSMGDLELASYKADWRESYRFRCHTAEIDRKRERQKILKSLEVETRKAAMQAMRERGLTPPADGKGVTAGRDWSANNNSSETQGKDVSYTSSRYASSVNPATACRVAARLMLARLFDSNPSLLEAIRSAAPVVVIDIADDELMRRVADVWQEVLFDDESKLLDATSWSGLRENYDAVYLVAYAPPAAKNKSAAETRAQWALSLALPFIAISPLAITHLPEAVSKAATDRIEFPRMDTTTIVRTIRIVTGKTCRERIDTELAAQITVTDLALAVRFDRTPAQCVAELQRLAALKDSKRKSRDLTLTELHGLGEARAWADGAIADIAAWKCGEISWDAVGSAVALTGPPGTGKTLFAKVFASEANLNLIACSFAKWQSSGDAHLGHLLRAMRADFDAARAQAPCVLFIDEIDSFPDRAGVAHAHRDYVIEVVNALLEQIDGIAGREGVILVGASNDVTRCDPALLRAGRFDKVVKIGFPTIDEIEQMFRVRLGNALCTEIIRPIAELAAGMTGADVERMVKDARRAARQAARDVTLEDLRQAVAPEDDRPEELRWRICVHEASHIVIDVIHFGPNDVFATTASIAGRAGSSIRTRIELSSGTYAEYRKRLEVRLAGRVGEEILLGAPSHGSGGVTGSDLHIATTLAADMVGSVGLAGPAPLLYLGPRGSAGAILVFAESRAAVGHELSEAAKSCRALLEDNQAALEAVARRLFESGRIDGAEVAEMIAGRAKSETLMLNVPRPPEARCDGRQKLRKGNRSIIDN